MFGSLVIAIYPVPPDYFDLKRDSYCIFHSERFIPGMCKNGLLCGHGVLGGVGSGGICGYKRDSSSSEAIRLFW